MVPQNILARLGTDGALSILVVPWSILARFGTSGYLEHLKQDSALVVPSSILASFGTDGPLEHSGKIWHFRSLLAFCRALELVPWSTLARFGFSGFLESILARFGS